MQCQCELGRMQCMPCMHCNACEGQIILKGDSTGAYPCRCPYPKTACRVHREAKSAGQPGRGLTYGPMPAEIFRALSTVLQFMSVLAGQDHLQVRCSA